MGKKWVKATKVVVDGIQFDSYTEGEFYKRYKEHYKRNTERFAVWGSELTGEQVTYRPDFISHDGMIWVEFKGKRLPLFNLREKLIKHYCLGHNIKYFVIIYDYNTKQFIDEKTMSENKRLRRSEGSKQLERLEYLWEKRKGLKDKDFEEVLEILKTPKYSNKNSKLKVKKWQSIRSLVLRRVDPVARLKELYNEK